MQDELWSCFKPVSAMGLVAAYTYDRLCDELAWCERTMVAEPPESLKWEAARGLAYAINARLESVSAK